MALLIDHFYVNPVAAEMKLNLLHLTALSFHDGHLHTVNKGCEHILTSVATQIPDGFWSREPCVSISVIIELGTNYHAFSS